MILWCFGSRYKANLMCDLYQEKVQELSGMCVGNQGLSLKQQGKCEDDLAHSLNEITLYNYICIYIYIYIYIK